MVELKDLHVKPVSFDFDSVEIFQTGVICKKYIICELYLVTNISMWNSYAIKKTVNILL